MKDLMLEAHKHGIEIYRAQIVLDNASLNTDILRNAPDDVDLANDALWDFMLSTPIMKDKEIYQVSYHGQSWGNLDEHELKNLLRKLIQNA